MNAAVLGDTQAELLLSQIGRLALQGQQSTNLIPRKTQRRWLAGGAVDTLIGDAAGQHQLGNIEVDVR